MLRNDSTSLKNTHKYLLRLEETETKLTQFLTFQNSQLMVKKLQIFERNLPFPSPKESNISEIKRKRNGTRKLKLQ